MSYGIATVEQMSPVNHWSRAMEIKAPPQDPVLKKLELKNSFDLMLLKRALKKEFGPSMQLNDREIVYHYEQICDQIRQNEQSPSQLSKNESSRVKEARIQMEIMQKFSPVIKKGKGVEGALLDSTTQIATNPEERRDKQELREANHFWHKKITTAYHYSPLTQEEIDFYLDEYARKSKTGSERNNNNVFETKSYTAEDKEALANYFDGVIQAKTQNINTKDSKPFNS